MTIGRDSFHRLHHRSLRSDASAGSSKSTPSDDPLADRLLGPDDPSAGRELGHPIAKRATRGLAVLATWYGAVFAASFVSTAGGRMLRGGLSFSSPLDHALSTAVLSPVLTTVMFFMFPFLGLFVGALVVGYAAQGHRAWLIATALFAAVFGAFMPTFMDMLITV